MTKNEHKKMILKKYLTHYGLEMGNKLVTIFDEIHDEIWDAAVAEMYRRRFVEGTTIKEQLEKEMKGLTE